MQSNSNLSLTLSLSAVLFSSLVSGCVTTPGAGAEPEADEIEATEQENFGLSTSSVTPLPSFSSTPNIKTAIAALPSPRVLGVARTLSGFQIYRCEQGATALEWKLRTPLAGLEPSPNVLNVSLNRSRFGTLVGTYHYRSDFGALLATTAITTLGLAQPPATAPVWDFTSQASNGTLRREVVAGRLVAQDTTNAANIPLLYIEIRGRSIDPGTATGIAAATHILRWNTRGGLAPAASTCTSTTLGREVQAPYSADYYFVAPAY